jgi:hypothetical protein
MWDKLPKIFSSVLGAILFPLVAMLFLLATSGVFSNFGTPNCNNVVTTNLIKQISNTEMAKRLNIDESKAKKSFSYAVESIKTTSTDDKTNAKECTANLNITNYNTKESNVVPITYTVKPSDDGKEIYVNVFGL